uniref:Deblocking aminopeptidase n=1 Tax=uncultured bacterium contig00008 TaxID=1181500 RepID=A0A806KBS7_9BACT|nr:deblocking aminopeptidase [uncultured bacterium contig00008]
MNKETNLSLIKELSESFGPSGFEDEAVNIIRRHGEGLGDFSEDAMRNLYLYRAGNKPNLPVLLLDAHSDEVGFLIRAVKPNGTLEFVTLGGWIAANVPAHRVLIRNKDGKWIPGIAAGKQPHYLSEAERKQAPEISEMVIDVGACSDKEVSEDYRIAIGSPVVPDVSFEYNPEHDIMTGKAFDNRLGCAAIISLFRELEKEQLDVQLAAAFAAQEELGLRGATVTAQAVKPDMAISFEGSPADDTLGQSQAVQTAIKKGPMLRHFDSRMITNPRFQRFALDLAEKNHIPVQEAVRTGGATNAGVIHLSGKAVPSIVIGFPARYIHTHYSIASYCDFENSVRLGCEIVKSLNEKVLSGF